MTEDISGLLKKICIRETASYPVVEMEKVIGFGDAAVTDIISCLKRERDFPRPNDELPLLVMLGEIRSPEAVDILIEYLKDSRYDITLEARIKLHEEGHGAKYLIGKAPLTLVYAKEYKYLKNAMHAERTIKSYTRSRKEELIRIWANAKLNAGAPIVFQKNRRFYEEGFSEKLWVADGCAIGGLWRR